MRLDSKFDFVLCCVKIINTKTYRLTACEDCKDFAQTHCDTKENFILMWFHFRLEKFELHTIKDLLVQSLHINNTYMPK